MLSREEHAEQRKAYQAAQDDIERHERNSEIMKTMEIQNQKAQNDDNLLDGDVELKSQASDELLGSFTSKEKDPLATALAYAEEQSREESN